MDEILFVSHPVYTDYETSRCGIVRNKRLRKSIGMINKMGYLAVTVPVNKKRKDYLSSRFIWECFNGLIPDGLYIDHINRDRLDNRIENLWVVTPQQNSLNSAPKIKLQYRRSIKGIMDNKGNFFPSLCSAENYYDINRRSIKFVADGIYPFSVFETV